MFASDVLPEAQTSALPFDTIFTSVKRLKLTAEELSKLSV